MSPEEARLLRRIWRNTRFEESGCWVWTAGRNTDGYGVTSINGVTKTVHRVILWLLSDMDLTSDMHVLHKCDNPPCWNPDHLFLGTNTENIQDAARKGRLQPRQGSKSPKAKINEEIAYAIKLRLRQGENQSFIARDMGIGPKIVNYIAGGHTWAHVQLPYSPTATYCDGCGTELFNRYKSHTRRQHECVLCYRKEKWAKAA